MSVVGIDLGTTNTVVACVRNGRVHVLADELGRRLLPSVVSFHPNGDILVGHNAKARRAVDARNTIASVKRLLGRTWNSPELEKARRRFAFEMKEGPGQGPLVVARGKEYTLPEIGAFVLKRAREIAEAALGERVERAVITVPAHFNELQRAATKVAGRVAGLEVLRILNEPTAAALAYGLGKGTKERIAIYDFGGGTFDATLLDLNGNVFEVLATAGDPFLGGDDIDDAIADRMCDAFALQHRYDPRSDLQALERLRQAAEQVKMALTTQDETQAHLREAFGSGGAHLDLTFGLSRSELEKMTEPLLERTFKVTQDALALARLAPSEFDRTILVGGTSRIPLVRRRVEAFFGAAPLDRMNPDEVVAIGAAIQAAALSDASRRRSIPAPPPSGFATARKSAPSFDDLSDQVPRAPSSSRPELASIGDDEITRSMGRDTPPPPSSQRIPISAPPSTARGLSAPPEPPPRADRTTPLPTQTARLTPGPPPAFPRPHATVPMNPPPPLVQLTPTPARGAGLPSPFAATVAAMPAPTRVTPPVPPPPPPPAPPPLPVSFEPPPPSASSTLQRPASASQPFGIIDEPSVISTPGASISDDITQMRGQKVPTPAPFFPAPPPPRQPTPVPPAPRYLSQPPRAPVFNSSMPPPVLIDVTPRALVVETAGGYCDTIIPRNAQIPCERTRVFATARDGQQLVRVRVAQGEESGFQANTFLGEVELGGIRAAPRGEVSVSVTFELDADGTLRVHAKDTATGRQASAQLRLAGIAGDADIATMRQRMEQAGSIIAG
jgi:molecular chaperone DnaK